MEERLSFFRLRENLALAVLVAAGAAFRVALALPVARLRGESDSVMTGLTAFKVLRGHHPVFYSGVRLGALEGYFHAAVFRIFGISSGALLVAPFAAGVGFVAAYALFAKELLPGRRAAFAAALAAIPLLAVTDVCARPTGYDVLMFLGAATLAFAARVVGGKTVVLSAWLTGLCAGLGLWNNLLSLTVTVPALIWIGFQARRRRGGPRAAPRIAAGFLLGALPFLAYNAMHPLATFRSSQYPIAPAGGLAQIADNARHFAAYDLVELALGRASLAHGRVSNARRVGPGANAVLGGLLLVELALAAGFCLWRLFRGREISHLREASPWEDLLPALIVAATAAANVFSWTGGVRGATVRYALPVALATPILLANLFGRLGARPGRVGSRAFRGLAGVHPRERRLSGVRAGAGPRARRGNPPPRFSPAGERRLRRRRLLGRLRNQFSVPRKNPRGSGLCGRRELRGLPAGGARAVRARRLGTGPRFVVGGAGGTSGPRRSVRRGARGVPALPESAGAGQATRRRVVVEPPAPRSAAADGKGTELSGLTAGFRRPSHSRARGKVDSHLKCNR